MRKMHLSLEFEVQAGLKGPTDTLCSWARPLASWQRPALLRLKGQPLFLLP